MKKIAMMLTVTKSHRKVIRRDGHVQPYFDEFVSFLSFHFLSPYFQPEDFKNLIKKIFGAIQWSKIVNPNFTTD